MQTGILKRKLTKARKKKKNQWEIEKLWPKGQRQELVLEDIWKKKIAKNKMRKSHEDVYTLILVFPLEIEK